MPDRPDPPGWEHAHHWGGGLFSILATLGWIVLLVGLAWFAWRWLVPYLRPWLVATFGRAPAAPSALEVLRLRYASGEIDAATFEHMWERLEASYQREPLAILPASHSEQHATQTRRLRRSTRTAQGDGQISRARHRRQLSPGKNTLGQKRADHPVGRVHDL